MKKIIRYIPYLLITIFLSGANLRVYAAEINDRSLQVERGEYRDDIVDYIQNNWMNFFGEDELKEYSGSDILIGQPYGVYNVDEGEMVATKFPVYVNGKCVQILDIFEDGDGNLTWSATISDNFLKEIDDLRKKKGKYRFEVKDDPNGGAPTLDFVKIDETSLRSTQHTLFSDINKPILNIELKDEDARLEIRSGNYPTKKYCR